MDAITGFYETEDINTLKSNFLCFPKFDRSIIAVQNANGLPSASGIIDRPLSALYYIKPGKALSVNDSVMFITSLFNENTPVSIGNKKISLREFMESHS